MGLKLVRFLLAGAVLLIGMSGTVMGGERGRQTAQPQNPGVCTKALQKMKRVLDRRKGGETAAGAVSELLWELPLNVSVYESENSPESFKITGIAHCFRLSGRWSRSPYYDDPFLEGGTDYFPRINAYVFFKNPTIEEVEPNLSVGPSNFDGPNRYMALTVKPKGIKTSDIAGATIDTPNIKENIIWLDGNSGKQKFVEVVLCEGPCRDILGFSSIDTTNDVPMDPDGDDQDGTGERGTSACNEPKTSDKDQNEIKDQHRNEIKKLEKDFKNERPKIEKDAITKFITSGIDFQFKDMNGNTVEKLTRNDLKPKECKPPKIEKKYTLKEGMRIHYKNCYSIPDFDILEAKPIIKDNTLTIIYKLKKSTPAKIKHIEMSVEMEGESKVTKSCSLQAKIVDSSTNKAVLENPFIFDSHKQKFSLEINAPIAWKGKSLVLKKGKKTDCQPKNGELKIMMEKDNITEDAILEIPKTTLYSTLGKALLVLNTMTGVKPVHEKSSSTTQLYPIADDQDSKELFIEMVYQTLLHLNGKYKDLIIGYRKNGELIFEEFTSYLDNHSEKKTAEKIVDSVSFTGNEFNWDSMIRAVNNHTYKPAEYAYWVFIGQSGLSDDKSYCENIPSKQEPLNQNVATYIYDFAVDENHYNPSLRELEDSSRSLPAIDCIDDNTNQHVVIFPQSKTKGWEKIIKNMLDNAFKSH